MVLALLTQSLWIVLSSVLDIRMTYMIKTFEGRMLIQAEQRIRWTKMSGELISI